MRVVTAEDIDGALTFIELVEALAEAFRSDVVTPHRHHHPVVREGQEATLLLMPAWTGPAAAESYLGVKIVSVFPNNAAAGLPSVLGTYLLHDGTTGRPLAALDGTRLTLWRTAAASALAARHLARSDARRLLMVGAGALAPFLVRAHASVRQLEEVVIWARRSEAAEALARHLAGDLEQQGIIVRPADELEPAVRRAEIVSCATLSREPLVHGAWLAPGTHLDLVGAFNLAMREADNEALRRASVFIDTEAARSEGGDVALGLRDGAITEADIRADLFALARGRHAGRAGPEEITLFKSVGTALEDLAAATAVWRRLRA